MISRERFSAPAMISAARLRASVTDLVLIDALLGIIFRLLF